MTLWTSADIAAATDGTASGAFAVTGVAFDSREVGPGDLFVALKGEATDGHRFLPQAFAQGAAGAIVSSAIDRPHVLVADTTAALDALGHAARARMAGKVIGVTGSVGKTGTKEALFAALDRHVPGGAHRSVKSYNNHVGVPLSLARMPEPAQFGVFEMGMNHPGELAQLTRMVRPHVAIVTAIAPAHAEFFADEAAIADAKAEIFAGLEPGGVAIIPHGSPHRDRLRAVAERHAARILTFGTDRGADVRALDTIPIETGTLVTACLPDTQLTFTLGLPGAHWVDNALAVLAAVHAVGGDLPAAGVALGEMAGLPGRGARVTVTLRGGGEATILDESYNANPASMAATLATLGTMPGRRLAVLGEMRELGAKGADYHAAIAAPIMAAGVANALLVGEAMAPLARALEGRVDFVHVADAAAAEQALAGIIAPGDVILVKGSNAVGLGTLVGRMAAGQSSCCI